MKTWTEYYIYKFNMQDRAVHIQVYYAGHQYDQANEITRVGQLI